MATYIIVAVVVLWTAVAVRSYIRQRKAGKAGCGGDCSRCAMGCANREKKDGTI